MRLVSAFLLALLLVFSSAVAQAASIVKVAYSVDGQVVAEAVYTGEDGGPKSDPGPYWKLLGQAPEIVSGVTIQPDQQDGKTATLKGKISIAVTIRNQFSMGTVKTDSLVLVRDKTDSAKWYLTAEELKRIRSEKIDAQLLIGKWKGEYEHQGTIEFTKDGKFKQTTNVKGEEYRESPYKVEGNKVIIEGPVRGVFDLTVSKLTETELVVTGVFDGIKPQRFNRDK